MITPEPTPDTGQPTSSVVFNLRVLALAATAVIAVIAITVFLISKRSIHDELEITISLVAVVLFWFLTYALHGGATLVGKPFFPKLRFVDPSILDVISIDLFDLGGTIGSIIAWLVLSLLFAFLLMFVLTALWSAILLLVFVLYWLFYRALRIVLVNSEKCRGDLSLSIRYSLIYTVLYTGWLFAIIWFSEFYLTKGR
jgi:hypothetical protein